MVRRDTRPHAILALLITLPALCAYGEVFNLYEFEEVATFPFGSGTGELGYFTAAGGDQNMPNFAVLSDETFVVNDKVNDRIVFLSRGDYQFDRVYSFPWRMYYATTRTGLFEPDLVAFRQRRYGIHALDRSGNTVFSYSFLENDRAVVTDIGRFRNFVYFNGTLFIQGDEERYYSVPGIGPHAEANRERLLGPDETHARYENGFGGVTIDEQNRLFINGELATRDYRDFVAHWAERNDGIPRSPLTADLELNDAQVGRLLVRYIGADASGNTYWQNGPLCVVLDHQGVFLDYFKANVTNLYGIMSGGVDRAGNVYFIQVHPNADHPHMGIYRVPRRW